MGDSVTLTLNVFEVFPQVMVKVSAPASFAR